MLVISAAASHGSDRCPHRPSADPCRADRAAWIGGGSGRLISAPRHRWRLAPAPEAGAMIAPPRALPHRPPLIDRGRRNVYGSSAHDRRLREGVTTCASRKAAGLRRTDRTSRPPTDRTQRVGYGAISAGAVAPIGLSVRSDPPGAADRPCRRHPAPDLPARPSRSARGASLLGAGEITHQVRQRRVQPGASTARTLMLHPATFAVCMVSPPIGVETSLWAPADMESIRADCSSAAWITRAPSCVKRRDACAAGAGLRSERRDPAAPHLCRDWRMSPGGSSVSDAMPDRMSFDGDASVDSMAPLHGMRDAMRRRCRSRWSCGEGDGAVC
mgnify:CR=1 FL=1